MKRLAPIMLVAGAAIAIAAARSAMSDLTTVYAIDASAEVGTPPCLRTYRYYAVFDDPADQLLAVGAEEILPFTLQFSRGALVNDPDSLVAGTIAEDFPAAPVGAAWDSYFTIGSDPMIGNDTLMSPGFGGSDGETAVLVGSSVVENGEGGWYDSNPGTPEAGGEVLFLQLTVDPDEAEFIDVQGVMFWMPGGLGPLEASPFYYYEFYGGGCGHDVDGSGYIDFGDLLIILSEWGPCSGVCCADLDDDGGIGMSDLMLVLSEWGSLCAP